MPVRTIGVYSAADLGINDLNYNLVNLIDGGQFTASASASPSTVTITDTDSEDDVFNDGAPSSAGSAPTQQLLNGTIDGVTYTNVPSNPENAYRVFDSSNNFVGYILDLHDSNSFGFDTLQGYVTTFEIIPGQTYSVSRRIDSTPDIFYDSIFVCFTRGTCIETANGPVKVQELRAGDLVLTKDHGLQPLRWIGKKQLSPLELHMDTRLRPVRIRASSLDEGLPKRDLYVSRQHRMLISSKVVERMFGIDSVLVAANKLTGLPGIDICEETTEVEYFHLLFDQHQVIFAEGAPTESLYTGKEALKAVSPEARAEILALFPELIGADYQPKPAQVIPENRQQEELVARHAKNAKMPLESFAV